MYSKTKRVLCVALFAVLCMTVICGSAVTARDSAGPPPPLETIMSINAKTTNPLSEQNPTDNLSSKDDTITYSYNEEGEGLILGPTDYKLIDSDRFCVLDTQGKYIRTYSIEKSAMINSIDISCCDYPQHFAYKDGVYYVYDIDRKEIFTFAEAGTPLGVIPLPDIGAESDYSSFEEYDSKELALFGADLVNHDGEIMLLLAPDGVYVHNDYRLVGNEFVECEPVYTRITDVDAYDEMLRDPSRERTRMTTITYGGHSWTLDAFGVGIDILGVDEDNNLYLYCVAHLSGTDGFMIKGASVRVYDAKSNLVSGVELNLDEFRMFPLASARMGEDNNLYFLAGTDDEMRLMKINTQKEYKINNEELYKAIDEDIQACSEMTPERGLSPTRTRIAAYNTAQPYVSYSYTVTPKNAHAWNDCILHADIAGITSNKPMTGVPYARGKMDTIARVNTLKTKVYGTYQGSSYYYCAGNINNKVNEDGSIPNYGGSFGVDCSGYASVAYGFSSHINSEMFYNNAYTCSSLKRMDAFVRIGHIMLYISGDTSSMTVHEASRSAGKVVSRQYSLTYLTSGGYKHRNPWHSGSCPLTVKYNSTQHWNECSKKCGYVSTKVNHSLLTKYSSNITHHWKDCVGCSYKGSYAQHTWIASGTGYICSVCKRTSPTNPGLTALPQYVTGIKQDIS